MTLKELPDILGERIAISANMNAPYAERNKETAISQTISGLAKQMINNADVVLRAEKLIAEGKIKNSTIQHMIGSDVEGGNG